MTAPGDTVAAPATPLAPGAIGAVVVTGPDADAIVARVFRARGAERGGIRVGEIVSPAGVPLDEAVALRLASAPGGEARLEIDVHGGRGPVSALLGRLAAEGARVLDVAEFRRFLVGRGDHDAIWLEASEALDAAETLESAAFLATAVSGRLSAAIRAIERALARGAPGAREELARLIALAPLGEALVRPPVVVLSGPPNAGKSTLFNALAGASVALTSPERGTTRDALEATVLMGRWPVRLVDTAGVGGEESDLDRSASEMAVRRAAAAAVVVRVVDGSLSAPDLVPGTGPVAVTRADRPPGFPLSAIADRVAGEVVRVSGETGAGLRQLGDAVRRALSLPERPPEGPVPFTERQAAAARAAFAEPDDSRAARLLAAARGGSEPR